MVSLVNLIYHLLIFVFVLLSSANNYQESQCEDVIKAMLQCCDKFGAAKSVCCSGFLKTKRSAAQSK